MGKNKIIINIPITTLATREYRYIEAAENAIKNLRALVWEMERMTPGTNIIANEELRKENGKTILFSIRKTIDAEAIKEPLENVENLVYQLREEINKLEAAVITELIKEKPQE